MTEATAQSYDAVFNYIDVQAKNVQGSGQTTIKIYLKNGFYNSIPKNLSVGYFDDKVQFIAEANGVSTSKTGNYKDGDTVNMALPTDATSVKITIRAEYSSTGPVSEKSGQT